MSSLKDKLAAAYDGSEKDTSDYKKYNKTGDPKFIDEPDELDSQQEKVEVPKIEEKVENEQQNENQYQPVTEKTYQIPKYDNRIQYGNENYSNNSYQSSYDNTNSYQQSTYNQTQTYNNDYNQTSYNNVDKIESYSNTSTNFNPEVIKKAIDLYEDIRRLDNNQKSMLFNILQVEQMHNAIYESINGDRSSVNAISNLIDLYKQQSVERAFNLMSTDTRDLKDIESLTMSILNKESISVDIETDKINYCRTLETEISKLSQDIMKNLEPISKILQKGID